MTDQATPVSKDSNAAILQVEAERGASSNFFYRLTVKDQTFDLQGTVRDNLSQAQIDAHLATVKAMLGNIVDIGGIAKSVGTPAGASTVVAPPAPPAPKAEEAPAPVATEAPAVPAATNEHTGDTGTAPQPRTLGALQFYTKTLKVTITNGKKLFKIGGGKWVKFGVTVWDEVLEKVVDINALEAKEYGFEGYIATFVLNDEGKPKKITNLEKV